MSEQSGCFHDGVSGFYGWTPNPAGVREVLARLPHPTFAAAARNIEVRDENALLWEACIKATGGQLPAHKQSIGCCTSEGWSSGVDYLQCVDIALRGKDEDYRAVSHAAFYGFGREVAGMLGRGDGCYGAAMAKAATDFGCVSNEDARDSDTDDTLAARWGRDGCPQEVKDLAKKNLVKTVSLVRSAEEGKAALTNGYPVPICSGQGFTMERDADGHCEARGSWAHCMCLIGYRADRRWFCILQSWGQNTPSGPTTLGQPDCSFWADWDVVDRMLREGDSFAVSQFDGFPSQRLDWLI